MLSRFSRLPGVSSLFNTQITYPPEVIDGAVSKIKRLGRETSSTNDNPLEGITMILSLMKKYSDSLHVQRGTSFSSPFHSVMLSVSYFDDFHLLQIEL